MLADADVERYSRQIVLAEVGGRGQERLLAARVVVEGDGDAAAVAADLLGRAGARVARDAGAAGVRVAVGGDGVVVARGAAVATLVGRPCERCLAPDVLAGPAVAPTPAASQALGALVASEALAVLLGLVRASRLQVVDLATGRFAGRSLDGAASCPACGGRA
jgi:molybdopterin/thiamine biosynthesis adenylyltransferase